jgi:uracil-DNA glycosylase family 4
MNWKIIMKKVLELYENEIFQCIKCKCHNKTMNPYSEFNSKIASERSSSYENRRKYLLDYINDKKNIKLMIIGLAPGLDGCGFSGIPFTDEYNAIKKLRFVDYHKNIEPYQCEESAKTIYNILNNVALSKGKTIKEISKSIFMTNSCQCIPLKTGTSIKKPSNKMLNTCWAYLNMLINEIKPETIIVLGGMSWENLFKKYDIILNDDDKLITNCVKEQKSFNYNGIKIIPEIHPSPHNRNNPNTKDLYKDLEKRLTKYIDDSIS